MDKLDGSLSGTVDLGGTYGNPSLNVVGSIKDVTIDTKVVGDAKIDASLENRKFKIRTLKLPVDDGLIAAGGTVDLDGDADLQIAVRDVDIEPFLPLIGDNINATGSITGVINMTGGYKKILRLNCPRALPMVLITVSILIKVLYWQPWKIMLLTFNVFKGLKKTIS